MNQTTCIACRASSDDLSAPGGVIHQDAFWRLEHILSPVPMAGWLILKPLRHVEMFAELTVEEAAAFGPLCRRVTRVMSAVMSPAKVYDVLFAEAENAAHVHFHLIPRFDDTSPDLRGPSVFQLLGRELDRGSQLNLDNEAARLATAVREHLQSAD